jgi:hypothetical protein
LTWAICETEIGAYFNPHQPLSAPSQKETTCYIVSCGKSDMKVDIIAW